MKPRVTITKIQELVIELPEDTVVPTITTHPYSPYEMTPAEFQNSVLKMAGDPEFPEPKTTYKVEWT